MDATATLRTRQPLWNLCADILLVGLLVLGTGGLDLDLLVLKGGGDTLSGALLLAADCAGWWAAAALYLRWKYAGREQAPAAWARRAGIVAVLVQWSACVATGFAVAKHAYLLGALCGLLSMGAGSLLALDVRGTARAMADCNAVNWTAVPSWMPLKRLSAHERWAYARFSGFLFMVAIPGDLWVLLSGALQTH